MANIANQYDPNAEASPDFAALPAGEYVAEIIESAIEDVSRRNDYGRCLKLTWKLQGSEYDGRLVWQRISMWAINITNNDKVVSIAQSQFASIRLATGKNVVNNTEEIHHIPCLIRISVKKSDQYGDQNEVKAVKPNGAPVATSSPPPAETQNGQQNRPWDQGQPTG